MMPMRCTFEKSMEVVGAGLFSGRPCMVHMHPGQGGLVLTRAGSDEQIPVHISSLAPQPQGVPARNTTLSAGSASIMTVEHLLSAIVGMGITDAHIEFDGPEAPIGDGSAGLFVDAIRRAGVRSLDHSSIAPITLLREVIVESGPARIIARPRQMPGCSYTYHLDYEQPGSIPSQQATFETDFTTAAFDRYATEIAPARTFCLLAEAQAMRAMGLFQSLSPRDMLVFGDDGPIDNALRFENEPARHKVLDLMGDLALVGRPLQLDIIAHRAGHALNHQLARAILAEAE
jgi:UDP-3-O-acyl N-acetylglucosamine deacetylase